MNTKHFVCALLTFTCLTATTLFAQGRSKQQAVQSAEFWHKMDKTCGLQPQFSVDMTVEAMGMNLSTKLYRLNEKVRTEMTLPMMNVRMAMLEFPQNGKNVRYQLFPAQKKYVIEKDNESETDAGTNTKFEITEAGTEQYEGVACKKRHLKMTLDSGEHQEMDMLFSPAQKNMPVKMTATVKHAVSPDEPPMEITSVIRFSNYQFAAPAASLFTLPADYTQAASMAEVMMSGMGAGGNNGMNAFLRQAMQNAAKENQQ